MYPKLNAFLLLLCCLFSGPDSVCQQKEMTAGDIIQRAINNHGGEKKLDSLHATESMFYLISGADSISVSIKRMGFKKYFMSQLSTTRSSYELIYDKGKAIEIRNDIAKRVTDPVKLEDLQLWCYGVADYGYKKLKYKFTRLDDQKHKIFDCYVVEAVSPLGRKTVLYYDKQSGNAILMRYPDGSISEIVDRYALSGVQYPATIQHTDSTFRISYKTLHRIENNLKIDEDWFNLPAEGVHNLPAVLKTGNFKYLYSTNNAVITRTEDKQSEASSRSNKDYAVTWKGDNVYVLNRITAPGEEVSENDEIRVRVVNWKGNKLFCHYINAKSIGRTSVFEKIQ